MSSFFSSIAYGFAALILLLPARGLCGSQQDLDLTVPVPPQNRHYDVVALSVPLVFNVYGDHDPNGMMFALKEYEAHLEAYARNFTSPDPYIPSVKAPRFHLDPLVRPLALRCNLHDTVSIVLENKICDHHVSIHVALDGHNIQSDGSAVGRNSPSLAAPGEKIKYSWRCDHEGVFHFGDAGNLGGTENDTNLHGLFGALIVEPFGSRWTDPHTGKPIRDGLTADIHPPKPRGFENFKAPFLEEEPELPDPSASFREHVTMFHDEAEVHVARKLTESPCGPDMFKTYHAVINQRSEDGLHAINYRSDPLRNRLSDIFDRINAGTLQRPAYGEETHHSSWMHGDPGNVFHNYAGDPVKFRVVHAGIKETHVFHWHVHQWYAIEGKTESPIIDSFSLSPQWATTFTALYGAGSRLKSIGDVVFHCHLYPHFTLGMWGIFRIFDKLQDGSHRYPDQTPIQRLQVLPDRQPPPKPTLLLPGFPRFIDGTVGQKSPRIPWPVDVLGQIPAGSDYRPATSCEAAAMNRDPQPGNFFALRPTPRQDTIDPRSNLPIRQVHHNVTAVNKNLLFNRYGWHDPTAHIYQLENEPFGERDVPTSYDPFIVRANKGDVLVNRILNKFDRRIPGDVFDPPFPDCPAHPTEGEVGMHVHLVKFDVQCSDGASIGWNYMSGARYGKYYLVRWWADEQFGHVFFHDHLFPNYRQKKGLYALAPIEPFGATYFSVNDLKKNIITGIQAVIKLLNGDAYREIVQFVADFHPAFTKKDVPLNPPNFPGSDQDNGIMLVNYKSEPLRERIKEYRASHKGKEVDPSLLFSSRVFGDPSTTVFQAYPGDKIRFLLAQGSHEEAHSFNAYGFRWHDLSTDPKSRLVDQQVLGISKAFTKIVEPNYSAGDHLVYWRAIDDTWLGCWSLVRVFDKIEESLPTLPSNPLPFGNATLTSDPSQTTRGLLNQTQISHSKTLTNPPKAIAPRLHREYRVVVENRPIDYTEGFLNQFRIDPLGLIYRVTAYREPMTKNWVEVKQAKGTNPKPLVLRMLEGEFITIWLTNNVTKRLTAEPERPKVPVDLLDYRRVSERVSIHADIVRYDVRDNDGTNVGFNPDQTVSRGETRAFTWHADQFFGGPIILQDQSDFRNHRHHGLIGALLVEPRGWVPSKWYGEEATLTRRYNFPIEPNTNKIQFAATGGALGIGGFTEEEFGVMDEHVLLLQDGLRLFKNGDLDKPIADFDPGTKFPNFRDDLLPNGWPNTTNPMLSSWCDIHKANNSANGIIWDSTSDYDQVCISIDPTEVDNEDRGQKAFNYRSAPTGDPNWLTSADPPTPIFQAVKGRMQLFHIVSANDKPRAISIHIHGHVFSEFEDAGAIATGVDNAINPGRTESVLFKANELGDWAVRAGNLRSHTTEGMWAILRVNPKKGGN